MCFVKWYLRTYPCLIIFRVHKTIRKLLKPQNWSSKLLNLNNWRKTLKIQHTIVLLPQYSVFLFVWPFHLFSREVPLEFPSWNSRTYILKMYCTIIYRANEIIVMTLEKNGIIHHAKAYNAFSDKAKFKNHSQRLNVQRYHKIACWERLYIVWTVWHLNMFLGNFMYPRVHKHCAVWGCCVKKWLTEKLVFSK